ncbi:hypothetical protein VA7868_00204 [Vibrio aerogenes CECT 7868]|uniref:Carboxymuconolactone decarboxylase family protein n=1 Tax=Vibrio aerogenes CECT 7868 TaxID=1216006 RepID=A0A1M5UXA4_9VIBR|nr:carboxymuconolactone decarboxylase family protein [Vibrio aerogenes]SHH67554.1 hypothetical protein VA7868_00204 [Vibrio aerogenes CECT 7868]
MLTMQKHTMDTAPEQSRKLLQCSLDTFGFIVNQSAYMSESPELLDAYQYVHQLFSGCTLAEEDRTVIWITMGQTFQCTYTVHVHQYIAVQRGVSPELLRQLDETPEQLPARLAALREFTQVVCLARGNIPHQAALKFLQAGYTRRNMLEIFLALSQKLYGALVNSLAQTPTEALFMQTGREIKEQPAGK